MSDEASNFNDDEDFEPEIWDEHQWEEFMKESDERTEKYGRLLEKYIDHPDRDEIIAKEMGWTRQSGEDDGEHDELNEFFEDIMNEAIEFEEEGEAWKQDTEYDTSDIDDFKNLPIYQKLYQFSLDSADLVSTYLADCDDESVEKFAGSILIPAAKVAGGFSFGFEREGIGGNIANCKRGLKAANQAMEALYEIGEKKLLEHEIYLEYYSRAKVARDELAIYIVELRERFERGF